MLKFLLLAPVLIYAPFSLSQDPWNPAEPEDTVYTFVDKAPEFPGGNDSLFSYLYRNFQFKPDMLISDAPDRMRVYLELIVHSDGTLSDFIVRKSDSKGLSNEFIRLLKAGPVWMPGELNNTKVAVRYIIPFFISAYLPFGNPLLPKSLHQIDGITDTNYIYQAHELTTQAEEQQALLPYHQFLIPYFTYPESLLKDTLQTGFTCEGVVDEKGRFTNYHLTTKPFNPLLDSLILDLMKNVPLYIPATVNGTPVKSYRTCSFFVYHPAIKRNEYVGRPVSPTYNTGMYEFRTWFTEKWNAYLPTAKVPAEEKNVYVKLYPNEEGKPDRIEVISGATSSTRATLVRILKEAPEWNIHVSKPLPFLILHVKIP